MLILFFVFINFSHLRARANTRALSLSLTHTHTHTHTQRQNFSAREANAATWAAAVRLDGPYNTSTFTCPVQSIATTLSLAKQRLHKEGFSCQLLYPQCRRLTGTQTPPPLSSLAADSLNALACEDKTFLLARSNSMPFKVCLKIRKV